MKVRIKGALYNFMPIKMEKYGLIFNARHCEKYSCIQSLIKSGLLMRNWIITQIVKEQRSRILVIVNLCIVYLHSEKHYGGLNNVCSLPVGL